jgi:hypothetical protein
MAGRVVGAALGGSPVAVAVGGRVGVVVGVAVGGPPAAAVATGADGSVTTGGGHSIDIALALVAAQRVRGHFLPRHCSDAELRTEDTRLQRLTDADRRLCGVYGDTIHQNDETHLDGGIGVGEDAMWQRLYLRVAACQLLLYDPPNGRWANRFLETLTGLWIGVIERF